MTEFFLFVLCLCVFSWNLFAQTKTELEILADKIKLGSVEEKRDALYRLRAMETVKASRIAIPALQDSAEIVRATATHSILEIPSDEAANLLLPLLNEKKSAYIREETAYALGKTLSKLAVNELLRLLNKDKSAEVRAACAVALGEIGDEIATESLIKALRNKNEFVQRCSARALGQIRAKQAVSPLIEILRNPKSYDDVKRESAWALGEIGDASATQILTENQTSSHYLLAKICTESLKKIAEGQVLRSK